MTECKVKQDPPWHRATVAVLHREGYDLDQTLKPVDISTDFVRKKRIREGGPVLLYIHPMEAAVLWFVMGFRVFNGPREIIIERIATAGSYMDSLYRTAFDAAAFNLDGPQVPPRTDGGPYKGEPFRFVKQDLGACMRDGPLQIEVRPFVEPPPPELRFDALMIVREERSMPNFGLPPPFNPTQAR